MRLVLLGSGAFALPTFEVLAQRHDIPLVVSQPDRPAGRSRQATPTPVANWAMNRGLNTRRPADINEAHEATCIGQVEADAWVVIAYGQKLSEELLANRFAINLHGSLLPRWRGAAPINHAMLAGDEVTGVSVITLASTMDAGEVLVATKCDIDPTATAGELHDTLAALGPDLILDVLSRHEQGTLSGIEQDPAAVTLAPKLSRRDATLELLDAKKAVGRINGLSPWPGVDAVIDGHRVRLVRAMVSAELSPSDMVMPDGHVGCQHGQLQLLEVQPPGKRVMAFSQWANGRRIDGPVSIAPFEMAP
jgi:methionyl-tRNA formyltransferase